MNSHRPDIWEKLKTSPWSWVIITLLVCSLIIVFFNVSLEIGGLRFPKRSDKIKQIDSYLDKLHESRLNNPELAYEWASKAKNLASEINEQQKLGEAYYWLAQLELEQSKLSERSAFPLFKARIAEEIFYTKNDPLWVGKVYELIASIYSYKSDPDSAYHYFNLSENALSQWNGSKLDSLGLKAEILKGYGTLALWQKSPDSLRKGIKFLHSSSQICNSLGDLDGEGVCLRNIGSAYTALGDFKAAKQYLNQALNLNRKINSNTALNTTLCELGDLSVAKLDTSEGDVVYLNEALSYYQQALDLYTNINATVYYDKGIAFHYMAAYEEDKGNPIGVYLDSASRNYIKGIIQSKKENNLQAIKKISKQLGNICDEDSLKSCKVAFKEAIAAYHQIANNTRNDLAKAEGEYAQFQFNSFEKQTKQEKRFMQLLGLGLLTTFGIIFISAFQRQKINNLRNKLESRLSTLQAQMNPHFLSNSLNAIESLIDNKEAAKHLVNFSRLSRMVLDQSRKSEISIEEESIALGLYLKLEQLRTSDKFDYHIDIPDEKTKQIKIPPMIIQPFVENAIWHGILPKIEKGHINIAFTQNEIGRLQCIIEDDGIGRKKNQALKAQELSGHVSYSTQIIKDRIELLKHKKNTNLKIIDLENEEGEAIGTRVEIEIQVES